MMIHSFTTRRLLVIAVGASLLPPPANAAEAARQATEHESQPAAACALVHDVALTDTGALQGQVFDVQGHALAATRVELWSAGRLVATTDTSSEGTFAIANLSGGVYQLSAGEHVGVYRLWPAGSQPPAARRSLAVVSGEQLVRGQEKRGAMYWLTNPWIIAAGLGAAIIIPVAISNSGGSSS